MGYTLSDEFQETSFSRLHVGICNSVAQCTHSNPDVVAFIVAEKARARGEEWGEEVRRCRCHERHELRQTLGKAVYLRYIHEALLFLCRTPGMCIL
jgi:hypothetical protein